MALKWKISQWNNPADKDAPKKFYASPVWDDEVDKQKLAEKAAKNTSLSASDVTVALDSLFDLIPDVLMDGDVVTLGRLGKLKISFSSEGKDNASDVCVADIKNVRVTFRPSNELKQRIAGVSIKKYEPKSVIEAEEASEKTEEISA